MLARDAARARVEVDVKGVNAHSKRICWIEMGSQVARHAEFVKSSDTICRFWSSFYCMLEHVLQHVCPATTPRTI